MLGDSALCPRITTSEGCAHTLRSKIFPPGLARLDIIASSIKFKEVASNSVVQVNNSLLWVKKNQNYCKNTHDEQNVKIFTKDRIVTLS